MPHDREKLKFDVMSVNDVVEAYKNYDASEEAKETVLYFVSELTGLSVDRIQELAGE